MERGLNSHFVIMSSGEGEGEGEEVTRCLYPTWVNKDVAKIYVVLSFFYSLRRSLLAKKASVDCFTSDGSNKV